MLRVSTHLNDTPQSHASTMSRCMRQALPNCVYCNQVHTGSDRLMVMRAGTLGAVTSSRCAAGSAAQTSICSSMPPCATYIQQPSTTSTEHAQGWVMAEYKQRQPVFRPDKHGSTVPLSPYTHTTAITGHMVTNTTTPQKPHAGHSIPRRTLTPRNIMLGQQHNGPQIDYASTASIKPCWTFNTITAAARHYHRMRPGTHPTPCAQSLHAPWLCPVLKTLSAQKV